MCQWTMVLGGCCLARGISRGNTKKVLTHAGSCQTITHADEKVSPHEPMEDVFRVIVIRGFVQERRWVDCRHSVPIVTRVHLRPGTVNGYPTLGFDGLTMYSRHGIHVVRLEKVHWHQESPDCLVVEPTIRLCIPAQDKLSVWCLAD